MKKKDYLLYNTLKLKVCKNNPHTLEDLMANKIQEKSANTSTETLQKFPTNLVKTIRACNEGGHFQHIEIFYNHS
jgi:hypothetical protein